MTTSALDVWQYWEGPMPGYVELCVETVRRHYPGARLLDRAAFDDLWNADRDVPIDHLGAAHRADFVRAYVLRHHGGLWLDSDFVLLRPFHELDELPASFTFAGYRIDGGDFTNNLMYSRPHDPVLRELYARICRHLRTGAAIRWLEIGSFALRPAITAHAHAVWEIPADLVCPIPWHQFRRFEEPGQAAGLVGGDRCGVMLSNNSATDELRGKTRETMLGDESLLADLLRRALPT